MSALEVLPPPTADDHRSARARQQLLDAVGQLARAASGGRVSLDTPSLLPGAGSGMFAFVPPPEAEQQWRALDLDLVSLDRLSPSKLTELMADLSPELSGALNDWLRFCNPGWELVARNPASGKPHPRAQRALDEFLDALNGLHGSVDVVFNRLFLARYLRGAQLSELVLDERGRVPLDIATPDPATIRFRRERDPVRGDVYRMGQMQGGVFVVLDRPTIRYVPVDPFPGSPYGRPMVTAAIFLGLFLLGLLRDVRRVVAQQGYPRLDVAIDVKRLFDTIPQELQDLDQFGGWLVQVVSQVTAAYQSVRPEDAYVHLDAISVNAPKGTLGGDSLGAFDGLVGVVERGLSRAMKTNPLIMGLTQGTSEAQANRQWEIYAARVKSAQHPVEAAAGGHFTLALEAMGFPAVAELRFAELRSAELLRDEQVRQLQLANADNAYNQGIISQDERALYAWGKDKADQEVPRVAPGGSAQPALPQGSNANPEPGSARARAIHQRIVGTDATLPVVPNDVPVTSDDQQEAADLFDADVPDYAGLLAATVVED